MSMKTEFGFNYLGMETGGVICKKCIKVDAEGNPIEYEYSYTGSVLGLGPEVLLKVNQRAKKNWKEGGSKGKPQFGAVAFDLTKATGCEKLGKGWEFAAYFHTHPVAAFPSKKDKNAANEKKKSVWTSYRYKDKLVLHKVDENGKEIPIGPNPLEADGHHLFAKPFNPDPFAE